MGPTPKKLRVVLGVIILVFVARIAATYPVFTDTLDAAWHISAGLEYLRTGDSDYEPQHPPLGRMAGPVRLERTTCRLGGGCSIH